MNDRSLIVFIIGFMAVFLFILHLCAVYFPDNGSAAFPWNGPAPSSTLQTYADLFNSRNTAAILPLILRSKRRNTDLPSVEDALTDHFTRDTRIDEIWLRPSLDFIPDGIVTAISCRIRWQMADGTVLSEERTVILVWEEGAWRLNGLLLPPSGRNGSQTDLPAAHLFRKVAYV